MFQHAFIKTLKDTKELDAVNATLLHKGSFISQTMAGVYTFLPLGLRVLHKIEQIVREEMDKLGAEMLMPTLSPRSLWEQTGRDGIDILLAAVGANDESTKRNEAGYIINPTHEELITPIAAQMKPSYRDLPFAVYQIQTKFRNEERPKSGLLRGREFRMKDLYSFHSTEEDLERYYEQAKAAYIRVYDRIGIGDDTVIALAGGGDFTKNFTHEFQTKCSAGEDTIYYDASEDVYYNKEVAPPDIVEKNESFTASEVGNIFPLGTTFSSAFGYMYTAESGEQKPVYMASYGLGTSRVMGVLVEKFHDDRGIVWPDAVAPFSVQLVCLQPDNDAVHARANRVYELLQAQDIDVLYDDRTTTGIGEKLGDADLIGCPWRIVVSEKTGNQVELKRRSEDGSSLIPAEDALKSIV